MERRSATQHAILDATEALLTERAFRDLSVEDVMAKAGLSRTAFYRYFPDLEAVLLHQLVEVSAELLDASEMWLSDTADPVTSLQDAGVALASTYAAHGRLLAALADASTSGPDVEAAWRTAVEGFVERSARRIEELRCAGRADVPNSAETARALVWMTERYLLDTYGRDCGVPIADAVATLVFIWRRTLFGT